jgi:hypothetical protein
MYNGGDILKKYRDSIMDKEYCSQVLTYMYLKGGCEESDINRDLKMDLPIVITTIKKLFVDGFVRHSGQNLKVTAKTIAVLEELGLGKITGNYLIQQEVQEEADSIFFLAYSGSELKRTNSIPTTISLLNIKKAFSFYHGDLDAKEKSNIVWTTLIGDDQLLNRTSPEFFVQKIFDTHSAANSDFWLTHKEKLQDYKSYYTKRCKSSLDMYERNNKYLMTDSDDHIDIVFTITLIIKIFTLFEDQLLDDDLNYFQNIDKNIIRRNISRLLKFNSRIEFYLKEKTNELDKESTIAHSFYWQKDHETSNHSHFAPPFSSQFEDDASAMIKYIRKMLE